MNRHIKYMYSKGNTIVRNFRCCSTEVKKILFKTYCNNIYGGHLWTRFTLSDMNRVRVSFNNVYRHLFNVKFRQSISQSMLFNNIDSFYVLLRKHSYRFIQRLSSCDNVLVSTIFNSVYFKFNSCTYRRWRDLIY